METAILIAIVGALNIVCFFIGAKVGQTVSKGERIETPELNPVKAIKEHQERKAAEKEHEKEQSRIDTIMRNIEAYDGTTRNQEDVPRG